MTALDGEEKEDADGASVTNLRASGSPLVEENTGDIKDQKQVSPLLGLGRPGKSELPGGEILEDFQPHEIPAQSSARHCALFRGASECSHKLFGKDCVAMVAEKAHLRMKLTILGFPDGLQEVPDHEDDASLKDGCTKGMAGPFIGFIVHDFNTDTRHANILYLAVLPEFRRRGYGQSLVQWCQSQSGAERIALVSLPGALRFYRALGFRTVRTWSEGGTARPNMAVAEGEVYMEYQPAKGRGRAKANAGKARAHTRAKRV